jgi:hypothetical protein
MMDDAKAHLIDFLFPVLFGFHCRHFEWTVMLSSFKSAAGTVVKIKGRIGGLSQIRSQIRAELEFGRKFLPQLSRIFRRRPLFV